MQTLREAGQWWLRLQEDRNPAAAAEWLAWAQSDPAHLDAFDRIEALALELKRLDVAQRAQLAREFSPQAPRVKPWREYARTRYAALAAGLVLAIGASVWMLSRFTPDAVYVTGRAVHESITLTDGSHVTVGADSRVAVHMRHDERRICLREGEAFFDVKEDPRRPFVVDVGNLSVTAVGTAFNVRKTGENIAVGVTEGRVRVMRKGGDTLEAAEGERVVYDPRDRRFKLAAVSPQRVLAWQERRLEFVNEPLSVVVANINRYISAPVRIEDAAASELTFTGTVLPDHLSAWLTGLPEVLPVRVAYEERGIAIYFQTERSARLVQ